MAVDREIRPSDPKRRSILLACWLGLVSVLIVTFVVLIWTVDRDVQGRLGWTSFLMTVVIGCLGLALAINWDNPWLRERRGDDRP